MRRIFLVLVVLTAAAVAAAVATGLVSWRDGGLHRDDATYLTHFVVGLFTAVGVLATHCLVITYFLGTGRWVKEVCLAYGLPDAGWPKQTRDIKRGNTPFAILAMLVTIGAAAAGAGRQVEVWPAWVHAVLAAATVLVNAWVWRIEYRNVTANVGIINAVYAEAERMRAERGLPPSSAAEFS